MKLQRIISLFGPNSELWHGDLSQYGWFKRQLLFLARVVRLVLRGMRFVLREMFPADTRFPYTSRLGKLDCDPALFTALLYLPGVSDVALVYVLGILKSACYAPTIPLLWAMIADVADDMEYRNHRRATGFCFSGIVFALKMGLGLGGALAGVVISCFGYQSGGVVVQTASAAYGIRLVSSLIPALLLVAGVVVLSRYPITKKYNENMQAELAARRNAARRY